MASKIDCEIVICAERGVLEKTSKMLVSSIRQLSEPFRSIPIFAYQPRKEFKVSHETVRFFETHEVNFIDINLNTNFVDYPLANKPIACAHREQHSKAANLVFCDSDGFFLNDPIIFHNTDDHDIWVRPVDIKNVGTNGCDENTAYWQELFDLLEYKFTNQFLHTTVDHEKIWPYFNSGLVMKSSRNNIFNEWKANFERAFEKKIMPPNPFYSEQSTLAATILQSGIEPKIFPRSYNFPIQLWPFHLPDFSEAELDSLVFLHYHNVFRNETQFENLKKWFTRPSFEKFWHLSSEFGLHSTKRNKLASFAKRVLARLIRT